MVKSQKTVVCKPCSDWSDLQTTKWMLHHHPPPPPPQKKKTFVQGGLKKMLEKEKWWLPAFSTFPTKALFLQGAWVRLFSKLLMAGIQRRKIAELYIWESDSILNPLLLFQIQCLGYSLESSRRDDSKEYPGFEVQLMRFCILTITLLSPIWGYWLVSKVQEIFIYLALAMNNFKQLQSAAIFIPQIRSRRSRGTAWEIIHHVQFLTEHFVVSPGHSIRKTLDSNLSVCF